MDDNITSRLINYHQQRRDLMNLLNDAIDKLHTMRLRDEDDVTAKACEDIAERSGKIKDLLDGL